MGKPDYNSIDSNLKCVNRVDALASLGLSGKSWCLPATLFPPEIEPIRAAGRAGRQDGKELEAVFAELVSFLDRLYDFVLERHLSQVSIAGSGPCQAGLRSGQRTHHPDRAPRAADDRGARHPQEDPVFQHAGDRFQHRRKLLVDAGKRRVEHQVLIVRPEWL